MNGTHSQPHGDDERRSTPKAVGEQVPEFELPGADEDGVGTFSLSEFTDEGAAIISFYSFDFSPACTRQLCGFRDAEWLTFTENVDVVGISVDSAYSHQEFRDANGLTFPLLTDRLAAVAEEFGVKHDRFANHPAVCQRAVFAVDDSRTVRYRWCSDDADDQPTLDDIEESIEWLA